MAYTTVNKSSDYFQTELWSAQDTSIDTINFAPDWVWIKSRTNADGHVLFDRVRGANKRLVSSSTAAEATTTGELTAFNSDGYTLGTGDNVNRSGHNYVSWNWRAAGTTGSANTDGTINSTVSVNTTSGFSIVKYTGTGSNATIGHGLGSVPKMIIVKRLSNSENWTVYHNSLGNTKYIDLDANSASVTYNMWQNTDPTSSVFSITTHNRLNANGDDYIAYCFAEKTGYSKFGSYKGTGSATESPFIYTGFRPALIVLKVGSDINDWTMFDTTRSEFNVTNKALLPNLNNAESTDHAIDILSNGFKLRDNDGTVNPNAQTMIYWAFGQSLVGTNNIPNNAR
jgi:hypothetical protein